MFGFYVHVIPLEQVSSRYRMSPHVAISFDTLRNWECLGGGALAVAASLFLLLPPHHFLGFLDSWSEVTSALVQNEGNNTYSIRVL